MNGIQFVTDDKGRKTAVLIDLKKHGALWEDFWDGLVSESRRKEKSIPIRNTGLTVSNVAVPVAKYSLEIMHSAQRELDVLDDPLFTRIQVWRG